MDQPAGADSIGELLGAARQSVRPASPPGTTVTAREAALLLSRLLETTEASVLAHPERRLAKTTRLRFAALWQRRLRGEPMAYLLGEREFYGRTFRVDRRVLVPRPETEHLVERTLRLDLPGDARVLDLATGSGCVALTLAGERPGWRLVATDRAPAALAVAAANRRRLALTERVGLTASDWCSALRAERFDAVTCNPPYVARGSAGGPAPEAAGGPAPEVAAWEPAVALFGGDDGLLAYRRLLGRDAPFPPGVPLVLEIGDGQLEAVRVLAELGGFALRFVDRDLRGIDRVVTVARSAA